MGSDDNDDGDSLISMLQKVAAKAGVDFKVMRMSPDGEMKMFERMRDPREKARGAQLHAIGPYLQEASEEMIEFCNEPCCEIHPSVPKNETDWFAIENWASQAAGFHVHATKDLAALTLGMFKAIDAIKDWSEHGTEPDRLKSVLAEWDGVTKNKKAMLKMMANVAVCGVATQIYFACLQYHNVKDSERDPDSKMNVNALQFVDLFRDAIKALIRDAIAAGDDE